MIKYGKVFLPEECAADVKPLASARLKPFYGLYAVSQILDLVIEASKLEIAAPVRLEAYTINERAMRISLAANAVRLEDGIRDSNNYQLTPLRRRFQLVMLGSEGLRLMRGIKLFGPEYNVNHEDELVIIETLLMMRQGVFLTAEMAQERVIEVLSVYM